MPVNDPFGKMRLEIIQLLRAQLEALSDMSSLTDAQLADCYQRHERVRELRDRLSRVTERELSDPAVSSPAAASTSEPVATGY